MACAGCQAEQNINSRGLDFSQPGWQALGGALGGFSGAISGAVRPAAPSPSVPVPTHTYDLTLPVLGLLGVGLVLYMRK